MLITIKQLAKKYPWPTEGALRAMVYHGKIKEAVVRFGRRVLIDEEKFFEILKMKANQGDYIQSGQQRVDSVEKQSSRG